jgi:uncharacterized protein YjbI with pentapeptide repeats
LPPDPNHAEVLCSGSNAWNAWREQNPSTIPDLTGIALQLSESNGGPVNLQAASLQGALLRFATLSTANLEAADLSGADLMHARLVQANLRAVKLTNARSDYADFAGANLTKANLCGASLRFTNLSTVDLEAADLSGADLVHARLDEANLTAANLTKACLDYADFAGANLTKANLCGASLHHVKNLTPAQIEESIGSASTILPPHLQGSVSWSVPKSQTEKERCDLRAQDRHTDGIPLPQAGRHKLKAWRVGVLICFVVLATTLMWRSINEAVPFALSGAPRGSEPFVIEPNLSTNSGDQGSQPAATDALMEAKVTADHRPIAGAETPPMPSGSSTADQTENRTEEHLASEAAIVEETNAQAELEASGGAKLDDEAASTPEDSQGSKFDEPSKGSAFISAQSRHAVPDVISAESPTATSRHAIVPEFSPEVSTPDPQFTSTTEVPAQAPAVNTLGPFAASTLSDTRPPLAVTVPLPRRRARCADGTPRRGNPSDARQESRATRSGHEPEFRGR